MEETLKAKIRNLLNPSYNLAHIVKKENLLEGHVDFDVRGILVSEANQSIKSIEEILKLLDNES